VLIDAIVLKIRDGQVANRPVYVAMGISIDGERDVLGLSAGPTGGEGAKQWMSMLTELRNRGVADVCVVCCDGLKGLPDAIAAIWPLATVQTCVVHLVRNAPGGVLAPKSKANLAFTMHMLSWLAVNGTAAIVEFPGALYSGGAEQKVRKYLVDNNYVDTAIQLPPDLIFGTTIATCIIVLKKSKADNTILFIDASAEFVRQGNKNKLTETSRDRILKAFTERIDVDYFARLVD
jgi:hypothetical protein